MPLIHCGIENCHFSLFDESGTYSTPVPMTGAVSLNVKTDVNISNVKVHLSDGTVATQPAEADEEYKEIELEVASLPDDFLSQILGYEQNKWGIWAEKKQKIQPFALLCETSSDNVRVRRSFLNCVCAKPEFDCTTLAGSVKADTRKLKIYAYVQQSTGYYSKFIYDDGSARFENWFKNVY